MVCLVSNVHITPPKTNEFVPEKRDDFNRKYIFQPLIFRGHVSFIFPPLGNSGQVKGEGESLASWWPLLQGGNVWKLAGG